MSLDDNLKLAHEAKDYARNVIKASDTSLEANKLSRESFFRLEKKIREMREAGHLHKNSIKHLYKFLGRANKLEGQHHKKNLIKRVKSYSIGNCEEYANLALNYFSKKGVEQAALLFIENDDHAFAVLGMTPNAKIDDPSTWGAEAVVCDPWADAVYPATDLSKHLQCYRYNETSKQNETYAFDPNLHILRLEYAIGGNDLFIKDIMILDAMRHLSAIRDAFVSLQDNSEEHKKLFDELEESISSYKGLDSASYSNELVLRHDLSKEIRSYLEKTQALASQANQLDSFNHDLVLNWIKVHALKHHLEGTDITLRSEYWHILTSLGNEVTLPLIETMDQALLNRIVKEYRYKGVNLLTFLLLKRDDTKANIKAYFNALLAKLDSATIEFLLHDDLTLASNIIQGLGKSYFIALLDKFAGYPYSFNNNGNTILDKALLNLQDDVIKILVKDRGWPLYLENANRQTPLDIHFQYRVTLVEYYFAYLEEQGINAADSGDAYLLFSHAIMKGYGDVIRYLLEKQKQCLKIDEVIFEQNYPALHVASYRGDSNIVKLLLDNKANPNSIGTDGRTALYFAVQSGQVEIVRLLLEKGADPNQQAQDGTTPLHLAVQKEEMNMVSALLKHGANPNLADNSKYMTPLALAVISGKRELIELLITEKADDNQVAIKNTLRK